MTRDHSETGGSVETRSDSQRKSSFGHSSFQSGRKFQAGSEGRNDTSGASLGILQSKLASEKSNISSHPRPRKRKPIVPIPDILPSISKDVSPPKLPDALSRSEWFFDWFMNNRNASKDERMFVIVLKSYGFRMAHALATEKNWGCQHLIEEAEARGL